MTKHTHTLTDEELFCLEGCRKYEQYHQMRQGFEIGKCVFCQLDRTVNQVLWEDENAMLWKVPEAYLRTELALHVLVVPKRHIRFEAHMTDDEAISILRAKQFILNELDYQGGNTHVREGDMRLNAGTVPHVHYNTFEPDPEKIAALAHKYDIAATGSGKDRPKIEVRIPVFKDPGDRKENQARASTFAARYESGEVPE